jgi:hypothetical protein
MMIDPLFGLPSPRQAFFLQLGKPAPSLQGDSAHWTITDVRRVIVLDNLTVINHWYHQSSSSPYP